MVHLDHLVQSEFLDPAGSIPIRERLVVQDTHAVSRKGILRDCCCNLLGARVVHPHVPGFPRRKRCIYRFIAMEIQLEEGIHVVRDPTRERRKVFDIGRIAVLVLGDRFGPDPTVYGFLVGWFRFAMETQYTQRPVRMAGDVDNSMYSVGGCYLR